MTENALYKNARGFDLRILSLFLLPPLLELRSRTLVSSIGETILACLFLDERRSKLFTLLPLLHFSRLFYLRRPFTSLLRQSSLLKYQLSGNYTKLSTTVTKPDRSLLSVSFSPPLEVLLLSTAAPQTLSVS